MIFFSFKGGCVLCVHQVMDYVTGCLLTRGGSKMLGMHQAMMVDIVLIGCLATKGGGRNRVIKESCWSGERVGRQ